MAFITYSGHMRNAMVMIVAAHMDEDLDSLFTQHKNGYLKTSIVRGEGEVTSAFMEGVHLMSTTKMTEALMGLMAAYYVFNVDYPPKLKRTFKFLQYEVMKVVGENDKKDSVMKSFYNKIMP